MASAERNHAASSLRSIGIRAALSLALLATLSPFAPAAEVRTDESTPAPLEEVPIRAVDREHWSFRPLKRPVLPAVSRTDWCRNSIDEFILSRLEQVGLKPMPAASRATLIRRVTLDLTGLPPTAEEIEAFEQDQRPGAWERLVDRLLASDRYGERWGQHWLDLARFAETDGFEHDKVRPNAWRYRDWVIRALNADMPYDQFVSWQLAGDEFAPHAPDAHIATGFLLCGPDMPDINRQDERRHNVLNEMTSTTGAVFLGLQFGCAQCHDHKFDPISQADFYRLRAFFESAEFFRESPLPDREYAARRAAFESTRAIRWEGLNSQIEKLKQQLRTRPDPEASRQLTRLETELADLKNQRGPQPELARVLSETLSEPVVSYVRIRGDFLRRGAQIHAAFPRLLNPAGASVTADGGSNSTGQRKQLAAWLTSPDHPLTTRVVVNRIWKYHFGIGLTESLSDFGIMGDEPSHPELLDWLAVELPRRGWSLKSMHRLILTSATYRQMSYPESKAEAHEFSRRLQLDPGNSLYSRMPRRRLEAEAIRDSMLAVAGLLSERRHGPGVRPPLPRELVKTLLTNQWPVSGTESDHYRRSIYLFVRRNLRYPLFAAFDKPDTNQSCARRDSSIIAPQALMMLNSQQSQTVAAAMARRLVLATGTTDEQIRNGYLLAFGRWPTNEEQKICGRLLEDFKRAGVDEQPAASATWPPLPLGLEWPERTDPLHASALSALCLAWLNTNEFISID